jgi:hypothetical protein
MISKSRPNHTGPKQVLGSMIVRALAGSQVDSSQGVPAESENQLERELDFPRIPG